MCYAKNMSESTPTKFSIVHIVLLLVGALIAFQVVKALVKGVVLLAFNVLLFAAFCYGLYRLYLRFQK